MIRPGDLREVISIQERSETSDNMGGFTETWANVSGMGSVRAAIWPISANELLRSEQQQFNISHRIRIWYRDGINSNMKIIHGTRTFNIKSIINLKEQNRIIEMLCEEENA